MHQYIKQLYEIIKDDQLNDDGLPSRENLVLLNEKGATATAVSIMLHQCLNIALEKTSEFVIATNIFPIENAAYSAAEAMEYLYHNE